MMLKAEDLIRVYLREANDGAKIKQIADDLDLKPNTVAVTLRAMPDTYIDRWDAFVPVWEIVTPPADCPKPNEVSK